MKYMLLMSASQADFDWYSKWSSEDLQAQFAFMHKLNQELKESGKLVSAEGLAFPEEARIVRAGANGEPVVTRGIIRGRGKKGEPTVIDGPFAETKEFVAGYWIVEVANAEEAYQIAARASAAPGPGGTIANIPIEVRRVMGGSPDVRS